MVVVEKRENLMILEIEEEKVEVSDVDRKTKNSSAFNDLLLAMTDDVSFGLVYHFSV